MIIKSQVSPSHEQFKRHRSEMIARSGQLWGGARRGAPMVSEWGPIARLVVLLGAWDSC